MHDSSFISIFFRVANFGILLAVGYYLYRKYMKASLEEQINQKEAILKGLEEQGYFLEGKVEDLDDQRRMQERHAKLLMQKVDEWHNAIISENHKIQEENRLFAARNAGRIALKNKYIIQHALQQQTAPLIMRSAQERLQHEFAHATKGTEYIHDIITMIKRKQVS